MHFKGLVRTRFSVRVAFIAMVLVGGSLVCAAPAYAAPPAIWVGSPVTGTWGKAGDSSTTPARHHTLVKASPRNDWAVDLTGTGSGAGAPVKVYIAPSSSSYASRVTAKITQIIDNNACANGGGGDLVTVQILFDGAAVGQVTYAHLDRLSTLRVNQVLNSSQRYGTLIGNVANLTSATSSIPGEWTGGSGCWTGPHVHTELRASTNYACWNRGYATGSAVRPSNFIGFVTGSGLGRQAQACP